MATDHVRQYQRQWLANRRAEYVQKRGGACEICYATEKLQFDHIDPDEKTSHRIFSWSRPRIEAELAKCQLLCYGCHRDKTNKDMKRGLHLAHGKESMYKKGCRCEPCRQAKRESR